MLSVPVTLLLVLALIAVTSLYAVEIWYHAPPQKSPVGLIDALGSGTRLPGDARVALVDLVRTVGMHAADHGDADDVAAPCAICGIVTRYRKLEEASRIV